MSGEVGESVRPVSSVRHCSGWFGLFFYFLVLFSGFVFCFFHARAKKKIFVPGETTTFFLIKKENKRY